MNARRGDGKTQLLNDRSGPAALQVGDQGPSPWLTSQPLVDGDGDLIHLRGAGRFLCRFWQAQPVPLLRCRENRR